MNARRVLSASLLATTLACGGEPSTAGMETWSPADHSQETVEGDTRGAAPDAVDADPAMTEIRAATSLFGTMCASCHGNEGRGDGAGRPPVAQVPDFTDATFQAQSTDDELAAAIRDGRGGFMPGFGDRLSPEGIAALVRHVRRFAPTPAPEPELPPAPEPTPAPTPEPAPAAP